MKRRKVTRENMQVAWLLCVLVFWFGCIHANDIKAKPNIVFVVVEDLGWDDVGFHGSPQIPTPTIDSLANSGVVLNNYYVSSDAFQTKCEIMTGKYASKLGVQHGVLHNEQPFGLPLTEKILPQYLKESGYKTHAVGKWGLGFASKEYLPTRRGFDSFYGMWTGSTADYFTHSALDSHYGLDLRRNEEIVRNGTGKSTTELFTEEAVSIIKSHESGAEPFFLYLSYQSVQAGNPDDPLQAEEKYLSQMAHIKNPKRRKFAAMVKALDDALLNVTVALVDSNLLKDSIIVFTTDNGGAVDGQELSMGSNYPLRGGKLTAWEGGLRAVGFVYGDLVNASGRVSDKLLHVTDWLPTLLNLSNTDTSSLAPSKLDGYNVWETISNGNLSPRYEILHVIDPLRGNLVGLRVGDYKMIINQDLGFYSDWTPRPAETDELDDLAVPVTLPNAVVHCDKSYPHPFLEMRAPPCDPMHKPCLFNILWDPCEYHNLAEFMPNTLNVMLRRLWFYRKTIVYPSYPPFDKDADPEKHGGLWDTWKGDNNGSNSVTAAPTPAPVTLPHFNTTEHTKTGLISGAQRTISNTPPMTVLPVTTMAPVTAAVENRTITAAPVEGAPQVPVAGIKEVFDVVTDNGDDLSIAIKDRNSSRIQENELYKIANNKTIEGNSHRETTTQGGTVVTQISSNASNDNPTQTTLFIDNNNAQIGGNSSKTILDLQTSEMAKHNRKDYAQSYDQTFVYQSSPLQQTTNEGHDNNATPAPTNTGETLSPSKTNETGGSNKAALPEPNPYQMASASGSISIKGAPGGKGYILSKATAGGKTMTSINVINGNKQTSTVRIEPLPSLPTQSKPTNVASAPAAPNAPAAPASPAPAPAAVPPPAPAPAPVPPPAPAPAPPPPSAPAPAPAPAPPPAPAPSPAPAPPPAPAPAPPPAPAPVSAPAPAPPPAPAPAPPPAPAPAPAPPPAPVPAPPPAPAPAPPPAPAPASPPAPAPAPAPPPAPAPVSPSKPSAPAESKPSSTKGSGKPAATSNEKAKPSKEEPATSSGKPPALRNPQVSATINNDANAGGKTQSSNSDVSMTTNVASGAAKPNQPLANPNPAPALNRPEKPTYEMGPKQTSKNKGGSASGSKSGSTTETETSVGSKAGSDTGVSVGGIKDFASHELASANLVADGVNVDHSSMKSGTHTNTKTVGSKVNTFSGSSTSSGNVEFKFANSPHNDLPEYEIAGSRPFDRVTDIVSDTSTPASSQCPDGRHCINKEQGPVSTPEPGTIQSNNNPISNAPIVSNNTTSGAKNMITDCKLNGGCIITNKGTEATSKVSNPDLSTPSELASDATSNSKANETKDASAITSATAQSMPDTSAAAAAASTDAAQQMEIDESMLKQLPPKEKLHKFFGSILVDNKKKYFVQGTASEANDLLPKAVANTMLDSDVRKHNIGFNAHNPIKFLKFVNGPRFKEKMHVMSASSNQGRGRGALRKIVDYASKKHVTGIPSDSETHTVTMKNMIAKSETVNNAGQAGDIGATKPLIGDMMQRHHGGQGDLGSDAPHVRTNSSVQSKPEAVKQGSQNAGGTEGDLGSFVTLVVGKGKMDRIDKGSRRKIKNSTNEHAHKKASVKERLAVKHMKSNGSETNAANIGAYNGPSNSIIVSSVIVVLIASFVVVGMAVIAVVAVVARHCHLGKALDAS